MPRTDRPTDLPTDRLRSFPFFFCPSPLPLYPCACTHTHTHTPTHTHTHTPRPHHPTTTTPPPTPSPQACSVICLAFGLCAGVITAFLSAGVITRDKFKDISCSAAFFMLVEFLTALITFACFFGIEVSNQNQDNGERECRGGGDGGGGQCESCFWTTTKSDRRIKMKRSLPSPLKPKTKPDQDQQGP
jgi:hypothetical protein